MRINKDEEYINEHIKFLNSEDANNKFDIFTGPIAHLTIRNRIGTFWYYKLKNIIDGRSGIYKLENNWCILVEIDNNLADSMNIDPKEFLIKTIYTYFTDELNDYGIYHLDQCSVDFVINN